MSELEALRQEIAELRREVAELRASKTVHHHYHQPTTLLPRPHPQHPWTSPHPYYPGGPMLTTSGGIQGRVGGTGVAGQGGYAS